MIIATFVCSNWEEQGWYEELIIEIPEVPPVGSSILINNDIATVRHVMRELNIWEGDPDKEGNVKLDDWEYSVTIVFEFHSEPSDGEEVDRANVVPFAKVAVAGRA